MSSFVTGNKMSFECVDQNPDVIAGKKLDNNRACLCSKLASHYFQKSTDQLTVLLTECLTTNEITTECCISIVGNFQYNRR